MASRMNGCGSNFFTPGMIPVLTKNQATNHTMWMNTKVMLPEKPPITSAMRSAIVRVFLKACLHLGNRADIRYYGLRWGTCFVGHIISMQQVQ